MATTLTKRTAGVLDLCWLEDRGLGLPLILSSHVITTQNLSHAFKQIRKFSNSYSPLLLIFTLLSSNPFFSGGPEMLSKPKNTYMECYQVDRMPAYGLIHLVVICINIFSGYVVSGCLDYSGLHINILEDTVVLVFKPNIYWYPFFHMAQVTISTIILTIDLILFIIIVNCKGGQKQLTDHVEEV